MTSHEYLVEVLETVRYEFVHERENAHIRDAVEINSGRCRWFAGCVIERLGDPDDVTRHDAWDIHTWLELDGRHYDAEVVEGVESPHELPVWSRLTGDRLESAVEACSILTDSGFPE